LIKVYIPSLDAPCSGNWNRYQSAPLMSNVYPTIKHPITIPTTHHKNIGNKISFVFVTYYSLISLLGKKIYNHFYIQNVVY